MMTDLLGIVSLATRGLAYTDTQELLMPVHATVPWHVFTLVLLIQRTTLFMLLLLVGALTDSRYCCLISTVLKSASYVLAHDIHVVWVMDRCESIFWNNTSADFIDTLADPRVMETY